MQLKSFFSCFLLLFLQILHEETCSATTTNKTTAASSCSPNSHCGIFTNISYPFRLKGDPATCGDPQYELACENKSKLLLPLFPGKNYQVKAINYNNFTVRLVDPGIEEADCSSLPRYFLSEHNFSSATSYKQAYRTFQILVSLFSGYNYFRHMFQHVIYMNCSNPVRDDPLYVDTSPSSSSSVNSHVYAIAGDLKVGNFKAHCRVKLVTPVFNFKAYDRAIPDQTFSYCEIHRMLAYGFEISWMARPCQDHCGKPDCYLNETTRSLQCNNSFVDCKSPLGFPTTCGVTGGGTWRGDIQPSFVAHKLGFLLKGRIFLEDIIVGIAGDLTGLVPAMGEYIYDRTLGVPDYGLGRMIGRVTGYVLALYIVMRFIFGLIIFFGKLTHIYWTRRHTSVYGNIEDFLQRNSLMPIRYSYKDIKKMTRGFKDKLGEGGYGTVYKGKLRSGPFVAVKMLGKPKANGQEFISEVATIGRIHHGNVVRLIGFCVKASKRALIYEFMPNGSLDKYISSKEHGISLTYDQMYAISLGVARGIAYLHQGCDMQILHFDIKPHNILLDEEFIPKVSDFGLAKLYSIDNSIVTLTAARGTIGYMAPELFYKNIGGVSYKADVYSFGMLLMEMANRRRNLNPYAEHSSQTFLPLWIYDQLMIEENEIEMGEVTSQEKNNVKKMFIVALWCIQLRPNDRPSMNKVIEMLEGDVESIIMPPKPALYPTESIQDYDESISGNTSSLMSSLDETTEDHLVNDSA